MSDYQLIVIGAGPGGYMAALRGAKNGLKTAVVERREAGGTCLNRGCVPTKTLLHSSQLYSEAIAGAGIGVRIEGVSADVQAMYEYKNAIVEKLRGGVESLLKGAGVDVLRGRGSVTGPGEVSVLDERVGEEGGCEQDDAADGRVKTYTADHILIATGAAPAKPPVEGIDLPGVLTSDDLLDGEAKLPASIVIIGGGVIGVEFATFYSDLGCQVSIVEGLDRLLPAMDRELGQNLTQLFKKKGVAVYTGAMVEKIGTCEGGLCVNFSTRKGSGQATGEVVLCAIGRRPYMEGLFGGGPAPEMDGRRIRVNERFETSMPGVYAIGDVASAVQLAHVATAQGETCVDLICGKEPGVDLSIIPGCIYCRPEIASVGLTEAEAKEAGIPVKVGKCTMFSNARTLIAGGGRSFMKVVAHGETMEILGAQMMCTNSTDMISQISQAMAHHLTAKQLLRAMRPHPTFEEALTEALENLVAKG